ncbi:MAG: transketolase family protein [Candidatus Woesearchaeota archaeon]|nr:transketolase family protein [Candidatus Woesearchaeota archaeon]
MNLNLDFENCEKKATRDGYGAGIIELAEKNKNVVALTADLTESVRLEKFKEKFPDRFFQIGIAEQNMVGIAAGLALSGKIPFASTFAVFCPGRSYDQVRLSVAYSRANVKIASTHAGVTVGEDGASHQMLEDIALTRVLPNMTVIVPCDAEEARKAVHEAAKLNGPVYLRFGREKYPVITTNKTPFKIGKAEIFKDGKDVAIIACGVCVIEAMKAAVELEKEKISAMVVNCHTIKPLDKNTIINAAKKTKAVVTVEEHEVNGGLGSAVAELLSQECPVKMKIIGVQDKFGESGKAAELMEFHGLTSKNIIKGVKEIVRKK